MIFVHFVTSISPVLAEAPIQFRADNYERDTEANTVKAKGSAWLKRGDQEVTADEVEIDYNLKRATAKGKVHIKDGPFEAWCQFANFNLAGDDALLEEAIVVSGQLVLDGRTIRRLSKDSFEMEEGTYSNCNLELKRGTELRGCSYEWKVYGRKFSLTLEGYVSMRDVIVFAKDMPVFYLPFFIAPVKTLRQSGFLLFSISSTTNRGTRILLPYFIVLGPWHDLTLLPSYYSQTGYHLGLQYRYIYSPLKLGKVSAFIQEKTFSDDLTQYTPTENQKKFGLIGEWALDLSNVYYLSSRVHTRQQLKIVSDPRYVVEQASDVETDASLPSLRSQISFIAPSNKNLFTAEVEYHQSLILPKDNRNGVDRGPVMTLPAIALSRSSSPLLPRFLSYEWDTQFTHFTRVADGYDKVPPNAGATFERGDYIREGQRLQVEPRLVVNVPMPTGFQLQPLLKTGLLLYRFEYPTVSYVHRQYAEAQLPVSLFLSKNYSTKIRDFEKINHVFQPRAVYASTLYRTPEEKNGELTHDFFFRDPVRGLSNPRFDILDQVSDFEYLRFELINRFRRKSGSTSERFFLIQVSEQFNSRITETDPRYSKRLGPIELLSELSYWRFSTQVQANFHLEKTSPNPSEPDPLIRDKSSIRESDWSSSLVYQEPGGDFLGLTARFTERANELLKEQQGSLQFYKVLPTYFDLEGQIQYSFRKGEVLGYRIGLLFSSKPRSCWALLVRQGKDTQKNFFFGINFTLDFGSLHKFQFI